MHSLPAPPMLMMDRITEISGGRRRIRKGPYHFHGELDITPESLVFNCHFPGDPVMPGCLGLDAMWQNIGYWLGWSGSPGKARAGRRWRSEGSEGISRRKSVRVRYEVDMRQVRRGKLLLELRTAVCLPMTHASMSPKI